MQNGVHARMHCLRSDATLLSSTSAKGRRWSTLSQLKTARRSPVQATLGQHKALRSLCTTRTSIASPQRCSHRQTAVTATSVEAAQHSVSNQETGDLTREMFKRMNDAADTKQGAVIFHIDLSQPQPCMLDCAGVGGLCDQATAVIGQTYPIHIVPQELDQA